jgi:hypothetical protein
MSNVVRKVHKAEPMHMPADLGDNATYEDYICEAKIAALYAKGETDEDIVKMLVDPHPDYGWDLDINEAIRIVKELRSK